MRAPYLADRDFTLYQGDALDVLRELPTESVHCVVTSPPYWGLRDYGTELWEGGDANCEHKVRERSSAESSTPLGGSKATVSHAKEGFREECPRCGARRVDQQLGLEPTPEAFVARMVEVFREVRRVLRPDGTCWVNLGDSYSGGNSGQTLGSHSGDIRKRTAAEQSASTRSRAAVPGMKAKDLVGIPWRVAFALQADGWYLRADIIWAKPNPMPESVTDRPTKAHEYVFLLTRAPRYFFDQEAVRESSITNDPRRPYTSNGAKALDGREKWQGGERRSGDDFSGRNVRSVWDIPEEQPTLDPSLPPETPRGPDGRRKTTVTGREGSLQHRDGERWPAGGANSRSVWSIATQAYPEAHFATYPEELVRRCILAGTSERGCCPECGAPWEREAVKEYLSTPTYKRATAEQNLTEGRNRNVTRMGDGVHVETLGWRPGCGCAKRGPDVPTGVLDNVDCYFQPIPCTVLDPFLGSGTTAYVVRLHGRRSIGIELNESYCELAARRLQQQSLFSEAT